ncbi:MAG: hypothetical protein U5L72_06795 [Bacteroidales bacterium]|nr:hypothetical protein [Bacteroidales bacterium]
MTRDRGKGRNTGVDIVMPKNLKERVIIKEEGGAGKAGIRA